MKEKEYYEGQIMYYRGANGTTIMTIIRIVSMPCPPNGPKEIFRQGKAFLCLFENLPFKNRDGTLSTISGYTILGDDPWGQLVNWAESPPEWADEEWDESDLFSKIAKEAVTKKTEDLEKIWQWTSLRTLCQACSARGERCKEQLMFLNKISFSFSLIFLAHPLKRRDYRKIIKIKKNRFLLSLLERLNNLIVVVGQFFENKIKGKGDLFHPELSINLGK